MKKRGKLSRVLIIVMGIVMGINVMLPAKAATQKNPKAIAQYAIIPSSLSYDYGEIDISVDYSRDMITDDYGFFITNYDMRILNRKGKVIRFQEDTMGEWSFKLKKNELYYYQIREVTENHYWGETTDTIVKGKWTKKIPFVTAKYSISQIGRACKARIKMPKIQGVKNYKIYMSYDENKGWKKIKTVKSGKSIIISKFKGKTLKKDKMYYYKIVPSKGVNSTIGCLFFNSKIVKNKKK